MAENFIHGEEMCYSDVLKILEAEYEKSKLRVFQDTLLCKRSIVEVELLFKEEVIRKNNRVKKKIRQHEFELQVYMIDLCETIQRLLSPVILRIFGSSKKIKNQFETGLN